MRKSDATPIGLSKTFTGQFNIEIARDFIAIIPQTYSHTTKDRKSFSPAVPSRDWTWIV